MIVDNNDYCINKMVILMVYLFRQPQGAFYMFVKLTDDYWKDRDKDFVLDLLKDQHVLLVHGSGFSKEIW